MTQPTVTTETKRAPSASRLAGTARGAAEEKKAGLAGKTTAVAGKTPVTKTAVASKTNALNKSMVPGKTTTATAAPDKSSAEL